jgi:hypothetical protein
MTNYFILDGEREIGPLSLTQLKVKSISKDTLIWFAGAEGWTKAEQIHELRILFNSNLSSSPFLKSKLSKMWNYLAKPNFKRAS